MNLKKHIPNIFTLGNLFCGLLALIFVFQSSFKEVFFFVLLGIVLDFFDGFLARLLHVSGELGKQLDSLADAVTSGVVPGVVMYMLIGSNLKEYSIISLIGLLLAVAAVYRLAKFNIDTRQSESFIGLPTPAMSLFVVSLPLIQQYTDFEIVKLSLSNEYVLIGITILMSYLMNANLPLFSLKFKSFGLKGNEIKCSFLLVSLLAIIFLKFLAIPTIIFFYVLLSVVENRFIKKS